MQHSSAGGGFFSKIKENYSSKLANLSISGGAYAEKDGSSDDDTLIHHAFVKYYDSKGLPYPDWLGVKTFQTQQQLQQQQQRGYGNQYQQPQQDYSQSKFQPVRHNNSYNNSYSARQQLQQQQQQVQQRQQDTPSPERPGTGGYQRSSSRLQDLYNKSRQQSIPGQGYRTSNTYHPNR